MNLQLQLFWLFVLAIPVACIAWTVTHEEVFREARDFCMERSENCRNLFHRKFFYLFTCEYCFSHYVSILFLVLTDFKLLLTDWRGYIISGFALVFVANFYMSLFALLRQAIKKEKKVIQKIEKKLDDADK